MSRRQQIVSAAFLLLAGIFFASGARNLEVGRIVLQGTWVQTPCYASHWTPVSSSVRSKRCWTRQRFQAGASGRTPYQQPADSWCQLWRVGKVMVGAGFEQRREDVRHGKERIEEVVEETVEPEAYVDPYVQYKKNKIQLKNLKEQVRNNVKAQRGFGYTHKELTY
jgi:hypothetical protein